MMNFRFPFASRDGGKTIEHSDADGAKHLPRAQGLANGLALVVQGGKWVASTLSGASVASVFGRTGAVVAQTGDYTPEQVGALGATAQAVDSANLEGHPASYFQVAGTGLALGETSTTAYRGDRGKTAYDHSQASGNPHSTTAAQVGALPSTTTHNDLPGRSTADAHPTSAITGLDAALASKEPDLGVPSVTSFLRSTTAGVRAWVQLVATDITDLATVLAAYLTKNNPEFTGTLKQSGTTRISSGGGGLFHDVNVSATGSDTIGAGPYWQVNNHPTSATDSWIGQLGADNDLILFRQQSGVWAEKWRFLQDGSLKQAGSVRITTSGGFRGEDIKLTGLIPTAGKMTKIGADGAIIAATNYDPKNYANVGWNSGTAPAGSWTVVLGAELIADADWLDGSSYELKGVLQSASGGYFSTRFSVGNFKTPTVVLPTGTVYVDIVVRVIVTGANVQVTWTVIGKSSSEVSAPRIGTASGAYTAASAHEIAVEINPDPSALVITTANITQRRHT